MDHEAHAILTLALAPDTLRDRVLATTPRKAPGLDGLPYDVLRVCSDLYYEKPLRRLVEALHRSSE